MEMVAVKCPTCEIVISADPWYAMVTPCPKCGGRCNIVGKYIRSDKRMKPTSPKPGHTLPTPPPNSKKDYITVNVKTEGLDEIEKQLERIRGLTINIPDFTRQKQTYIVSFDSKCGDVTLDALRKFGEETIEAIKRGEIAVIPRGFKLTILNKDGTTTVIG